MCLLDKLPDWLVAAGTIGAVWVALFQGRSQRRESASRTYFDAALSAVETAVKDFLGTPDGHGPPRNDRRHWINFARGIGNARDIARRIESPELKELWIRSEHYWRERTYDALSPMWASFPVEYYGYSGDERHKNIGTAPGERMSLSESSLVFVYHWIEWPKDVPDALDKRATFTDDEVERMETFGPRGLADYIRILRELRRPPGSSGAPR